MKIRKMAFESHPVLGTIELDFTNKSGESVNTIIIAGENGAGKSVVLNELYEISAIGPRDTKNQKKSFEIELNRDDIDKLKEFGDYKHFFASEIDKTILQINIDYTKNVNWEQITITGKALNGTTISHMATYSQLVKTVLF